MLGVGAEESKDLESNQAGRSHASEMSFGIPYEAVRESSVHCTIKKRLGGKAHPNLVNLIKVKRKQNSLVIITEHVSN